MRAILFTTLLLFSLSVQSQKKELRKIDKLVLGSFFIEAKDELETSKTLILASEDKYRAQYYFYDAKVNLELKFYENAISSFLQLSSISKSVYPTKVEQEYENLIITIPNTIVSSAVNDNKSGNFLDASKKLIMAYEFDTDKYIDYLYFAAESSVSAQDFDTALKYYLILKEKGYTGIVKEYFITENETGNEIKINETEYNLLKSNKDYSNPRVGQTESRLPGIVKNIAVIYVQKGEFIIAEKAVQDARKLQPNDLGLLLTEGNIYLRISNESDNENDRLLYVEKFKNVMEKAVQMDPENGLLYFNLGIIFSDQGDLDSAEKYFRKSAEFNYNRGYLGLAETLLDEEKLLVEEMNSLGTSKKDNEKYDELLKRKEQIYLEVVPILEKSLTVEPDDLDVLKLLRNIYGQLGNTEMFSKLKAKIEELQGN